MRLFFIAPLAVALLAPLFVQAALPDPEITAMNPAMATNNPIVARGQGFEIRRSEIDQVLKSITTGNPADRLPPDAEIHALNQLIEIQLVLRQATDAEKTAGAQAADLKLANLRKHLGAPAFEQRLQATGMTEEDLRVKLAQEATAQSSLARQLGINVTDAVVRKYYDDHPVISEQPEMVRVREILLSTTAGSSSDPLPDEVVQARHRQIFELHQRVHVGEDLAALARQYNDDPGSKANAGELPPFRADQMEFGDLAFSMQTNQISEVLTNSDGYRFFQLLEKLPAQKIEYSAIADKITKAMIGDQKRRLAPVYLEKLRAAAQVEILDARLKAMIGSEAKPPPSGAVR